MSHNLYPDDALFFVCDAESRGLWGSVFAWGYVIVRRDGTEVASGYGACRLSDVGVSQYAMAKEIGENDAWLKAHVVPHLTYTHPNPTRLLLQFWDEMQAAKAQGCTIWADVPVPVESMLMREACGSAGQPWSGPYPLLDIATLRLAAGLDPTAIETRTGNELPAHHPLADARQSARLLLEALDRLDTIRINAAVRVLDYNGETLDQYLETSRGLVD